MRSNKASLIFLFSFIVCNTFGQNIFHTPGNTATQCTGRYFDDGGNSNYSNGNSGNDVQIICPSTPGDYISLNFTQWNVQNCCDNLVVFDGGTPSATYIGTFAGTSPGTITSSATDGCLSLRFNSDGSVGRPGWRANISCTSSPGSNPASSALDCGGQGGSTICSDDSFTGGSSGEGVQELNTFNRGCLESNENEASWYYFSPASPGSVEFTITPTNGDDYDFAIWGPYTQVECPFYTLDSPIRCSYASGSADTGLRNGSGDNSETNSGDGFVEDLDVRVGEVYVLLVDNFSSTTDPFDLDWVFSGGSSLDCNPTLPVSLISQNVECNGSSRIFNWRTGSEVNSDYYDVQRSEDGSQYKSIGRVAAAGNSAVESRYSFVDDNYIGWEAYYRLVQYDTDGTAHIMPAHYSYCKTSGIEVTRAGIGKYGFKLNYTSTVIGDARIKIVNSSGQTIYESIEQTRLGSNRLDIYSEHLSPGVYFYTLSLNGLYVSDKFNLEN